MRSGVMVENALLSRVQLPALSIDRNQATGGQDELRSGPVTQKGKQVRGLGGSMRKIFRSYWGWIELPDESAFLWLSRSRAAAKRAFMASTSCCLSTLCCFSKVSLARPALSLA